MHRNQISLICWLILTLHTPNSFVINFHFMHHAQTTSSSSYSKLLLTFFVSSFPHSATPAASPKCSYRRSVSEEHHHPRDIVTLNAVNQTECSCGVKEKLREGSIKSSTSPDEDVFQHAPTSFVHKTSDKEWVHDNDDVREEQKQFLYSNHILQIYRQLQKQLCEMSSRLDNLEGSLRKDIHTILDILHRQHQQQQIQIIQQPPPSHSHHSSQHSAAAARFVYTMWCS